MNSAPRSFGVPGVDADVVPPQQTKSPLQHEVQTPSAPAVQSATPVPMVIAEQPVQQQQQITDESAPPCCCCCNPCCYSLWTGWAIITSLIVIILMGYACVGLRNNGDDPLAVVDGLHGTAFKHVMISSTNGGEAYVLDAYISLAQTWYSYSGAGVNDEGSADVFSFLAVYNGKDGSGKCETKGIGVSATTSSVQVNLDDIDNFCSNYGEACKVSGIVTGILYVICMVLAIGCFVLQIMKATHDREMKRRCHNGAMIANAAFMFLAILALLIFNYSCASPIIQDNMPDNTISPVTVSGGDASVVLVYGGPVMNNAIVSTIFCALNLFINTLQKPPPKITTEESLAPPAPPTAIPATQL